MAMDRTGVLTTSGVSAWSTASASKVEAVHLYKQFENKRQGSTIQVLQDVSLSVRSGEFLSIVGPSGCGKTTLLRIFAGLISPSEGGVLYDGAPISGPSSRMGFVFQSDNLMPWRTVEDNVALGPELRHERQSSYLPRVKAMLELVGLAGFADYYPHQLSGGMRQRVNLARALSIQPDVLLMDEPFASLDAQTRDIMQEELLRIWRETRNTVIFITHQIDEALFLADRVVIMRARPGSVQEICPVEIERPRSLEVKRDPRFTKLADHIWHGIERQVRASIEEEQLATTRSHAPATDDAETREGSW
jgi:NitT/TauT family transport system ATP-binding protein